LAPLLPLRSLPLDPVVGRLLLPWPIESVIRAPQRYSSDALSGERINGRGHVDNEFSRPSAPAGTVPSATTAAW
jgi:hypothetical protein